MRTRELIEKLQAFDSDTTVVGTWEGQTQELDVYQAADGCVMVDVDGNHYKCKWQNLKCSICGEPAKGLFIDRPMCYIHLEKANEN